MSGFYKDYNDSDQTYLDTAEQAAQESLVALQKCQAILTSIYEITPVDEITGLSDALDLKANATDIQTLEDVDDTKLSRTETINGGTY